MSVLHSAWLVETPSHRVPESRVLEGAGLQLGGVEPIYRRRVGPPPGLAGVPWSSSWRLVRALGYWILQSWESWKEGRVEGSGEGARGLGMRQSPGSRLLGKITASLSGHHQAQVSS